MQGTRWVGGLVRLLLCAFFLCLAWIVLSSSQARADERPTPPRALAGERPAAPAVAASLSASVRGSVGKPAPALDVGGSASTVADEVVVPAVKELRAATDSALVESTAGARSIAEIVPNLEGPVEGLSAQAAAIVELLPVVGDSPQVALPSTDAVPRVVLPGFDPLPPTGMTAEAVVAQGDPATTRSCCLGDEPTEVLAGSAPNAVRAQSAEAGSLVPPTAPAPWGPPESSPMPPAPPTSGAGASAGDSAVLGPYVALPSTTRSAGDSADWRIPRAQPAHPGTRPD